MNGGLAIYLFIYLFEHTLLQQWHSSTRRCVHTVHNILNGNTNINTCRSKENVHIYNHLTLTILLLVAHARLRYDLQKLSIIALASMTFKPSGTM